MDWSNEKILEFISKYELEPAIWNPPDPNYRKKQAKYEAWERIKNRLGWSVTVDELKRKMNSLMAYYRAHLHKYKKSLKTADEGNEDVYHTNWFAFSAMNRFLAPVYECQQTLSMTDPLSMQINEENETQIEEHAEDSEIDIKHFIDQRAKCGRCKRRSEDLPSAVIIDHTQHSGEVFQQASNSSDDEYDTFGKLISMKIRKLSNHNTREIVMNDIFNLIFRAGMSERHGQPDQSRRSTFLSQHDDAQQSPNPSTSQ